MLGTYLNQTATHRPHTGTNDWGGTQYGNPVQIACRKQAKIQNVLTRDGQTVQTQHIYYLKSPVKEGDILDSRIVMAVSAWNNLNGNTVGYKAVV